VVAVTITITLNRSWLQQQPLVETQDTLPLHQVILNHYQTYSNQQELQQYKQKRSNSLSQLLFIYVKENLTMRYRQGMHKIASLVLLRFEFECRDKIRNNSQEHYSITAITSTKQLRTIVEGTAKSSMMTLKVAWLKMDTTLLTQILDQKFV